MSSNRRSIQTLKILKPHALKPGDTLGIIACSTPLTTTSDATINRSFSFLRNKGFEIVEAPNCRKFVGHSAGSIKERVKALHDFFRNPKIAGILSYWGGYQSHQLLEYLDYDLIRRHPKPLIGFSDTTALQIGIHSQTGLVCFSGPAGITFGKSIVPEFTWEHFEKVLLSPSVPLHLGVSDQSSDNQWWTSPTKEMIFKSNAGWKTYRRGTATGRAIGGNIGTMLLLAGTKYFPKLKGSILFFEDDEVETPKTIDRMFFQLRQMGVFDQISGMVIGRFHSNVGFTSEDSPEMILDDALKGYKFPVITNVDFGHTDPLITIPIGVKCSINTAKNEISFLEAAVVGSGV